MHVTVAAIIERDGRFLLVEEIVAGKRVINQPAGHLEPNESLQDAVVRETLEETGWHFRPDALVGIYHWQHPDGRDTFVRFCFCGELVRHEATRELDDGIERTVWLSIDELTQQQAALRSPLVLACINDYRAGRRFEPDLINTIL